MKSGIPHKKLIAVLKKYRIKAAYLFGSAANGKTHAKSDVDIAVRFSRQLLFKGLLLLNNELTSLFGQSIDLVDLDRAPLSLQFRVFRARTLLYAENPKEEVMKKAKALSLYHDYKYYYDRFREFEMKRILAEGLA